MKELTVLGIDLAKHVFHVVGMDSRGHVVLRKKLSRTDLPRFASNLRGNILIGMEACSSAHYWGRVLKSLGHEVKLIAPQYVKPYVKSNKNDDVDAEAIAEAVTRPTMRFVPLKSVAQQDIQSLHRVRERLVKSRTALVNETRGLLLEYGIVLPKTVSRFRQMLPEVLDKQADKLTSLSRKIILNLYSEYLKLDIQIAEYEGTLKKLAAAHPVIKRLQTIPGVGYLTATAIVASVSDVSTFKNGRGFAAWLGLVPRQHSSGGKPRLLGISKRGDVYVRKLLVHGARAVLRWATGKPDRLSRWANELKERRGANRAAVALANKNARIIWAILVREEEYRTYA